MIVGLGTDIVEVSRIAKIYEKFRNHFLDKILTHREEEYLRPHRAETIAGHFAAKEAAAKALGTGFAQGISFKAIEILHQESGMPLLFFHDAALNRAQVLGVVHAHLSISHERNYATATVILEGESHA